MSFEPQNPLEQSLIRAGTDPAHRPQFYKDLVAADIFIVQEGPPPAKSGRAVLKEGRTVQIRTIQWNGRTCMPVFSSLPRLQAVLPEEAGYLALNALELMKITQGAEWVLNPGSAYGKEFTRDEIASIIDGSIWKPKERYVTERATEVMLGQPANYPKQLVEALIRYFKTTRQVKEAYLAHFFNPARDEKPHTLIGIAVDGDWDVVMAGAGIVAEGVQVPDPPIDFIQITGKGGLEDYFRKDCKPFYKRKLFGIF